MWFLELLAALTGRHPSSALLNVQNSSGCRAPKSPSKLWNTSGAQLRAQPNSEGADLGAAQQMLGQQQIDTTQTFPARGA